MARPFKEGLDYFPLDVDFLEDKKVKLIKSEFGAKGILILISLLALVYKNNGYFYKWDDDDCYLMSDGVGCGCSPELIQEVLQGCIRRSIFDDRVFNMFSVLTSKGIQERYIKAVTERRNITILQEYWLIDLSVEKGLSTSILNKITFNSINPPNNSVNPLNNSVNPLNNTQSKVKESKEKNKEISSADADDPSDNKDVFADDSNEIKICNYLISKILSNNPKAKIPDKEGKQKWAEHIDKLIRLDKHTKKEIVAVIDYSQTDSFWKSNILSTKKLRDKFDTLWLQYQGKGEKKNAEHNGSTPGQTPKFDKSKFLAK